MYGLLGQQLNKIINEKILFQLKIMNSKFLVSLLLAAIVRVESQETAGPQPNIPGVPGNFASLIPGFPTNGIGNQGNFASLIPGFPTNGIGNQGNPLQAIFPWLNPSRAVGGLPSAGFLSNLPFLNGQGPLQSFQTLANIPLQGFQQGLQGLQGGLSTLQNMFRPQNGGAFIPSLSSLNNGNVPFNDIRPPQVSTPNQITGGQVSPSNQQQIPQFQVPAGNPAGTPTLPGSNLIAGLIDDYERGQEVPNDKVEAN